MNKKDKAMSIEHLENKIYDEILREKIEKTIDIIYKYDKVKTVSNAF